VYHEHALISAFVQRARRERYLEIVSKPALRHKFTNRLAHFTDFDPKYRVAIDKPFPDHIARELHRRHSPQIVFGISEDRALDQKEVLLKEALERAVGRGMGTVLSCIPGRLAFVETEEERFLLHRREAPDKCEYVRFVIGRKNEDSHVEDGIFGAIADALAAHRVTGADAAHLYWLREWFNENLDTPDSFGRARVPRGICWFKTGATLHIARIWEMVEILERHGVYVRKIRTGRPGYVIYEDEWQLVAEPFRKGTVPRG
jgi:hypothetical protein